MMKPLPPQTLTLDGQPFSQNLRLINGQPYVPLRDLAVLLNRDIVAQKGGYRLASGKWQFELVQFRLVPEYRLQYGSNKALLTPKESGDVLFIAHCRLRNGTNSLQEVSFDTTSSGNTALLDNQGRGFTPLAYDSRNSEYASHKLPAGTRHDFVILFSVPQNTRMKILVYTLGEYGVEKGTQFRIALKL